MRSGIIATFGTIFIIAAAAMLAATGLRPTVWADGGDYNVTNEQHADGGDYNVTNEQHADGGDYNVTNEQHADAGGMPAVAARLVADSGTAADGLV
jgi:hypothetical protein